MKSVSGFIFQRFWTKISKNTVLPGDCFYYRLKSHRIVRSGQRIRVAKINLILSGTFFMMGTLRLDPHLFECQAYLPADIFPSVFRSYVHVGGVIIRLLCWAAIIIQMKQIKFLLCAKEKEVSGLLCLADCPL